jgi:glucose-6-phosphate isomerase
MDIRELTGLDFQIGDGKLEYKSEDFKPAVDWDKTLEVGSYAYSTPESELKTLYFGARYMERTEDQELLEEYDFMADATVINPGIVGKEFIKTVGHYHGHIPGSNLSYPEVYEAVTDGFEYLLQSEEDENGEVDVIWVVTEAGDKIVMPPNWGHVSMNVGDKQALEVDLQKRENPNQSDYSMFKEKCGGAFYRTKDGLTKNPNYKVKSLKIVTPKEVPEWGLTKDTPLYESMINSPEKFEFLTKPEKYQFDFNRLFEDAEL